MKNYQDFKLTVEESIRILKARGINVTAKKWTKQSPYQKARYKPEYVFPEVWLYSENGGGLGIVITGEDVESVPSLVERIAIIA